MSNPKKIKQILEEMQAAGKLPPGTISVKDNTGEVAKLPSTNKPTSKDT